MILLAALVALLACAGAFAQTSAGEAAEGYLRAGEVSQVRGDWPRAETLYKTALGLLQHSAALDDLPRVTAFDDLGWLYVSWGKMAEGARLMDEARARAERVEPDDPRLIQHWDTQAAYLVVLGRYSEARRDWAHALEIGRFNYGPDSPKYAAILVHCGQASSVYGDYKNADEMLRRYLTLEPDPNRETEDARAVAQGELAHVYVEQHRYLEARRLFDRALAVFQNDPKRAPLVRSSILLYLGDFYMDQRQWGNAQLQYREAVNIQRKILGVNNAVASSMISLSAALKKLHQKNEAQQWMARAKAILTAQKDELPPDTVDVLALSRE